MDLAEISRLPSEDPAMHGVSPKRAGFLPSQPCCYKYLNPIPLLLRASSCPCLDESAATHFWEIYLGNH